jgi:hypothetical protein
VRIDIFVNNYNYGRFLGDAIDSALTQTHPHVRVIVVDDGSTDDSPEVMASYGERIVAVRKANGGQGSAFNAGFAAAEGDVVMFLDADDTLHPDIAGLVASAAAAHPDAAKIQWRMELADADGRPTGTLLPARHIPLPAGDMRRAELTFPFDIPWSATTGNAVPSATLAQIMPMPVAQYRIGADSYLQHLTALLGTVVSLDVVGAYRRVHGGNALEQLASAQLDLEHIHEAIGEAAVTRVQIELLAGRLRLARPPGEILSVSDLGHRLVSLRLDPRNHPVPDDTRGTLVAAGVRAACRRFDVRPAMRIVFGAWFAATALAPRPAALRLGRWLLFPEQRVRANQLLRRLHRGHDRGRGVRILLLTPMPPDRDGVGAIPALLHAQLTGLVARHEVSLVCVAGPDPREIDAVERLRSAGFDVHPVLRTNAGGLARWRRRGRFAYGWLVLRRPWRTVWFADDEVQPILDRLLGERAFDVVAAEDDAMGVFAVRRGVPSVLTVHELGRARPQPASGRLRLARDLLAEGLTGVAGLVISGRSAGGSHC